MLVGLGVAPGTVSDAVGTGVLGGDDGVGDDEHPPNDARTATPSAATTTVRPVRMTLTVGGVATSCSPGLPLQAFGGTGTVVAPVKKRPERDTRYGQHGR